MNHVVAWVLGVVVGVVMALSVLLVSRRQRKSYQNFIDQYLKAENVIHAHIREHILREKDLSWGIGLPPSVTIGIKEDGTVMSDEEFAEARRMAEPGAD